MLQHQHKPYKYLDSCGVEPEVVAEHEEQPEDEGQVVRSQGWQNVPVQDNLNTKSSQREVLPCGGRGVEEPDEDDGGVLQEGEAIVEEVFVSRALLLRVEEHEDIDNAWKKVFRNAPCAPLLHYQGQAQRETPHTGCCKQLCAGRSPRRPSPIRIRV